MKLLCQLILHYQKSRFVHNIYVTWQNPTVRPPEGSLRTLRGHPPVKLLLQRPNPLNNRFNPISNLEPRAGPIYDDDMRIKITNINYVFEVWKRWSYSIIRVFSRPHRYGPNKNTYNYEIRSLDHPHLYSVMLTRSMPINIKFLYAYVWLLPIRIHCCIEKRMKSEDIAMNLLVSRVTRSAPAAALLYFEDFGTISEISGKIGHPKGRPQCAADLMRLFGKDMLDYNGAVFLPFHKMQII